jgi:hypothetical protein
MSWTLALCTSFDAPKKGENELPSPLQKRISSRGFESLDITVARVIATIDVHGSRTLGGTRFTGSGPISTLRFQLLRTLVRGVLKFLIVLLLSRHLHAPLRLETRVAPPNAEFPPAEVKSPFRVRHRKGSAEPPLWSSQIITEIPNLPAPFVWHDEVWIPEASLTWAFSNSNFRPA